MRRRIKGVHRLSFLSVKDQPLFHRQKARKIRFDSDYGKSVVSLFSLIRLYFGPVVRNLELFGHNYPLNKAISNFAEIVS